MKILTKSSVLLILLIEIISNILVAKEIKFNKVGPRQFRMLKSSKELVNSQSRSPKHEIHDTKISQTDIALPESIKFEISETSNFKIDKTFKKKVSRPSVCQEINEPKFEIPIRVLIEKKDKLSSSDWLFESENGFILIFPTDKKRILIKSSLLNLKCNFSKKLIINGRFCRYNWDNFFIIPITNNLKFQNCFYEGLFSISKLQDSMYLVNHLDLEDYVATVLPCETWPTWPNEVNYALAVCIRSYAISKILEQRSLKKQIFPFDIKNTTVHQVYKGSKEPLRLKSVVKKTKGLILAFNKKPILAMFDISCGGIIPANLNHFNFKVAPYLARSYKCTYCKNFKCFKWQQTYTFSELQKKLTEIFPKLGYLKSIKIIKKDKAGVVLILKVEGSSGSYNLGANKLKGLLKLKSLFFSIKINRNKIIFDGKGFGHLTGLCQFGLYQMIKDGWNFKDALKFYYPKTNLMKLVKE